MSGQRKILSFFKVTSVQRGTKRTLVVPDRPTDTKAGDEHDRLTPAKKRIKQEENGAGASPRLSPEQKACMKARRLKALERLNENNIPPIASGDVVDGAPQGMAGTWARALSAEFTKPYFIKLQNFVEQERRTKKIYPPAHQVYTWTHMCPIHEVKVVILGQDPYHGPGQAHGLCFSVQKGVQPPPRIKLGSLGNMFKELSADVKNFEVPSHGDLTGWARQGVLLLNAVLTVQAHQANSHKDKGWETFTTAVITWLSKNRDDIVFLLWGSYAQKKGSIINTKRHHVLKGVHPSPLSAYRGFFGCKHFSKTNDILKKIGKEPIDWGKLDI